MDGKVLAYLDAELAIISSSANLISRWIIYEKIEKVYLRLFLEPCIIRVISNMVLFLSKKCEKLFSYTNE